VRHLRPHHFAEDSPLGGVFFVQSLDLLNHIKDNSYIDNAARTGANNMAYATQDMKKAAATQLKTFMPKGWKWSLAVRDRQMLVLTIASAPVDLLALYNSNPRREHPARECAQMSHNGLADNFKNDAATFEIMTKALAALKGPDYFDHSDRMRDYVEVSHYFQINIGTDDKPFTVTA
jgi:hypothetical protein